jgi:hypothetical protein
MLRDIRTKPGKYDWIDRNNFDRGLTSVDDDDEDLAVLMTNLRKNP